RARDRAGVVKALKTAIASAKAFDIATYNAQRKARDKASERRDEAGNKAFEGLSVPGILGDEWRRFIQAGEEYQRKNPAATIPWGNALCLYALTPPTASALELVRKYRDFSNNEIKAALDAAERHLRDYSAPVAAMRADAVEQQLAAETNGGPDVLNSVKA